MILDEMFTNFSGLEPLLRPLLAGERTKIGCARYFSVLPERYEVWIQRIPDAKRQSWREKESPVTGVGIQKALNGRAEGVLRDLSRAETIYLRCDESETRLEMSSRR